MPPLVQLLRTMRCRRAGEKAEGRGGGRDEGGGSRRTGHTFAAKCDTLRNLQKCDNMQPTRHNSSTANKSLTVFIPGFLSMSRAPG